MPKILIKPRTSAVASSSRNTIPTTEVDSPHEEQDDDPEADEGQAMDVDQDPPSQPEDNPQTGDEDTAHVAPAGRPRGRPRGRGRGATSGTGTPRPRGRGRGRARGRGRGASSLLIRLPKRGDDDADLDGDADVEGEADADEGTTPLDGDVELVEKEAPMGGGKPFQKIHGQVHIIDGDEFVTEDNPIGDEKIDKFGNLLGGTRLFFFFEHPVIYIYI